MHKPGKALSIIGLIVSAALLAVGSYYISPLSRSWAMIWSLFTGAATAYFAYYTFHGGDDEK